MLERISLPASLPPMAPVASPTPLPQAGVEEVRVDSVSLGTGVDGARTTPGAASRAVGVASATGASPAGASGTGASPAGASATGALPAVASATGASPAGASGTGASPAGVSGTGASPAGASGTGASPAGASATGALPAGASATGALPAGASDTRQTGFVQGLLQGQELTALVSSTLSLGVAGFYAAPLLVTSSQGQEQEAQRLVDAMVSSPIGFLQRRVLVGAALDFGLDNLKRVVDGGVKLQMLEDNPFSDIRPSLTASYTPDRKLLKFPPARLDNATVLHELGHALDDVIEPDEGDHAVLRSHKDEKLQSMYHDYCQRVEGLSFWQRLLHRGLWSDYATTSPQEYVAEGVMDYTRSDSTRRRLERNDPALAAYVHDMLTPNSADYGTHPEIR